MPDRVAVGRVGKPHGIRGAFVVEDASEDPERFAVGARAGFGPETDAGLGEKLPGELLARIVLAARRHVGMRHDVLGPDDVAGQDRAAQRDDGGNLARREIRIAEIMTGIGNLDADRPRIDIGVAVP